MIYANAHKFIHSAPPEIEESFTGERLKRLWQWLDLNPKGIKYLRLTGISGKSICAQLLSAVYENTDSSIGTLLLPLQGDFRDNIRINHRPLSTEELTDYVQRIYGIVKERARLSREDEQTDCAPILLSRHELLLTVALLAFQAHHCKFCIVESDNTDADPTRLLPPPLLLSVCGPIPHPTTKDAKMIRSYIQHGIQEMICDPQNQESYEFLSNLCAKINCRLTMPSRKEVRLRSLKLSGCLFDYQGLPYETKLFGSFQVENTVMVLEMISALRRFGFFVSQETVRDKLSHTKLSGKCEILSVSPTVISDCACHTESLAAVADSLLSFQPLMGERIRLCMPEGKAAQVAFEKLLRGRGYEITSVVTAPLEPVTCYLPPQKNYHQLKLIRQTVQRAMNGLKKNEILFLCGPSSFVARLRQECINQLGF